MKHSKGLKKQVEDVYTNYLFPATLKLISPNGKVLATLDYSGGDQHLSGKVLRTGYIKRVVVQSKEYRSMWMELTVGLDIRFSGQGVDKGSTIVIDMLYKFI